MKIRKVIDRTYSTQGTKHGTNVAGGVSAAVAANVGEKGTDNRVSSQSRVSIKQNGEATSTHSSSKRRST